MNKNKKIIDKLFYIFLLIKAIDGILEALAGILLFLINEQSIINIIKSIFYYELVEDPKDFVVNYTISLFSNLSANSKLFVSFYLMIHGIIKILLVIGFLSKKLIEHIIAGTFLMIFLIYEIYIFIIHPSLILIIIIILDMILLILAYFKYKGARKPNL